MHHQDPFTAAGRRHGRPPLAASGSSPIWVTPPTRRLRFVPDLGDATYPQDPHTNRMLSRPSKPKPRPHPSRSQNLTAATSTPAGHCLPPAPRPRGLKAEAVHEAWAKASHGGSRHRCRGMRLRGDAEAVLLMAPACAAAAELAALSPRGRSGAWQPRRVAEELVALACTRCHSSSPLPARSR